MSSYPRYGNLLPSAARTATVAPIAPATSAVGAGGASVNDALYLVVTVTANPGAQTLALTFWGGIPGQVTAGSGAALATFPTISTNGTYHYLIAPGAGSSSAGVTLGGAWAGVPVPPAWTIGVTHSSTGSWTYKIDYALM